VSSPRLIEKLYFSLCERSTEKLFLTVNTRKNKFFCHYISVCIFLILMVVIRDENGTDIF